MPDMAESQVSGVSELVLDQPHRLNAFTADDIGALSARLATLAAGPDPAGPVVVRGEGRAFCAGADLGFVADLIAAPLAARVAGLALAPQLVRDLIRLPAPTVAAVHGAAYGGGACLALACDTVVAEAGARFGFVFTRLGLPGGDMSAPWLLARRVGSRAAWRLLADAAEVTAEEGLAMGLVDEVVPAGAARARAHEVAARWAALPVAAVRATKRQVLALEGAEDVLLTAAAREQADIVSAFGSPEVAARVAEARRGRPDPGERPAAS